MNIQFISHQNERFTYLQGIAKALAQGCRWIQLRMKDADEELLYNTALEAQRMCKEYGATFIIDDHVGLAKRIHADGVHLGRNDMPIAEARALLGNDYIIGGTANTIEDVRNHWRDGADYIGCGPFRFTTTKARLAPILGLEGYERLVKVRDGLGRPLPLVAIGGITIADVPSLMSTGVDGVAISGCVVRAAEPVGAMRSLCRAMEEVG